LLQARAARSRTGGDAFARESRACRTEQGVRVIEVNDNPSLDAGIEDAALGDALYDTVMRSFGARLEG
jgi:glutathione synthase/RimK-type ligase-like ATP-grasp enzyme